MKHFLLAIFLCGTLSTLACSSLNVNLPTSRLDSPEVAGENWKKAFDVGLSGTHSVTVVNDASLRPPSIGTPTIGESVTVPFKFALAFWDHLEIGARYDLFSSPLMGTAKLQLLGASALKSKPGNFSFTVTAGYGSESDTNSGSQEGTFGPGGFPWSASATTQVTDLAAIIGIRVSNYFLFYGGPFVTRYTMTGYVQDNASSDGTSPAVKYTLNAAGQNTGGNFAVQWNPGAQKTLKITLEGVLSNFQWSGPGAIPNVTQNDVQISAGAGLIF